ncbi:unnamed protein product [Blepharisma stoltei]|uniref:RING-type E3 ubiquitin transferase n=1 Tax=Blepharisma stoltei TaxID=1481888 RepID=A0AAU9IQK9_9CILI|nr:unnamed protein product [Blepharisma stoltei]
MSERSSLTNINLLVSSSLECPICAEFFTIPIFQCDRGHSICDRCSEKIPKCPFCKSNIGRKLRNYSLEQQLSLIDISCHFKGCTTTMKLSSRISHEIDCRFNPSGLKCLMPSCRWAGTHKSVFSHLNMKHKIPHYDVMGDTAEFSSRLRSNLLPPIAGCVKLLHTFHYKDGNTITILTYIFMDSTKNLFYPQFRTLENFSSKFTLKIWNIQSNQCDELTIAGKALTIRHRLDEEREKSLCLKLDLESVIDKFSYEDIVERDQRLLHYRLSINGKVT